MFDIVRGGGGAGRNAKEGRIFRGPPLPFPVPKSPGRGLDIPIFCLWLSAIPDQDFQEGRQRLDWWPGGPCLGLARGRGQHLRGQYLRGMVVQQEPLPSMAGEVDS